MIEKILNSKRRWSSLILSGIGSIIGVSLLLISLQVYFDVDQLLSNDEGVLNNEYLVIKKDISEMIMIGFDSNLFTSKEIYELKNESFVNELAPFKSCHYQVYAQIGSKGGKIPAFYTLAYLESIPDEFIDSPTNDWDWAEGSEEVPVIMPTTFIDAYNFGIALSMGTPQISENLLKSIRFKLNLKGNNKAKTYYGKVISLTDRVNSILVPENFIDHTNKIFGNQEQQQPSRIIISTKNTKDPLINKFLTAHNYSTNKEQLKGNQIQQIMSGVLYYQFFISVIIVFQSVLLFVFYAQILVIRSNYEIKLLLMLGYHWQTISKKLNLIFFKVYLGVILISFGVLYISKHIIDHWFMVNQNIELPGNFNINAILIGLGFVFIFIIINRWNIRKKIIDLAK